MSDEPNLEDVLGAFADTLLTEFPVRGILDQLVGRVVEILPVDWAGVTLISEEGASRYIAVSDHAAMHLQQLQTELDQGPCLQAYRTGQPVTVADLRLEPRFPEFCQAARAGGLAAVISFPLGHGENRLGSLDLYREVAEPLSVAHMKSAQTLANVAAAYLLNAQIRSDLLAMSARVLEASLHDQLTGLANRTLLLDRLATAVARAQGPGHRLAVMFVDLDLNGTNDRHGHRAGDQLLVAAAGRLQALLRPGGTLARFAGDQFVLLLDDLEDAGQVTALATRVVAALSGRFTLEACAVTTTCSVGVAVMDRVDMLPEELLWNADDAMYRAKRGGGGRFETFRERVR